MTKVERVEKNIRMLADVIGERNIWQYANLTDAANYIRQVFAEYGYAVQDNVYQCQGKEVTNIIAERVGVNGNDIIIIGAHYDTPRNCPGANGGASGIAALLELAYFFQKIPTTNTLRFVAFVNEEAPFTCTPAMGSYHYAKCLQAKNENVIAMFSLQGLGCFSNQAGTQKWGYLFPTWDFPTVANFVAFVSNFKSHVLLKRLWHYFKYNSSFPCKTLRGPSWLKGINSSDQWAFWRHNYPAVMITDTSPLRYMYHHCPEDTSDKLNYKMMYDFITIFMGFIVNLANNQI